MLIVALGWSLLEAILKSKTEHIMENCHHQGSAINKTFIKMYIHTIGGHSTSRKNKFFEQ